MATTQRTRPVRNPAPPKLHKNGDDGPRNLRHRWEPVSEDRIRAVLATLDHLAQMSQRGRYHYTNEEVAMLMRVIREKVNDVERLFKEGRGSRPDFSWSKAKGGE